MLSYILETVSVFVLDTVESLGYVGIFTLSALESANVPIPSEVIIPFPGFLASRGVFNFWLVVLMGATGNLTGSLVSYFAATKLDNRIRKKREFIAAQRWFDRFGIWSVFIGRLLPIVRTFISFPAGMFKVSIWKFSVLTFVGSFIWSWFLAYIGFTLGENWDIIGPYFRKFDFVVAGVIVVGIILWLWHRFKTRPIPPIC